MKLITLTRVEYSSKGIFGMLEDDKESFLLNTLERAYESGQNTFIPKVPRGTYTCVRGDHKLLTLLPFETFEVTGVIDHSGILFHPGNKETDSEGCILLGLFRNGDVILSSRAAFYEFMKALDGINTFTLEVV